jgi:ribosome biogenesis GTPase / thiamine phosphate phosphatase
MLVLLAADPEFSESQLARALIAAREAGIPALVVLNKRDLQPGFRPRLGSGWPLPRHGRNRVAAVSEVRRRHPGLASCASTCCTATPWCSGRRAWAKAPWSTGWFHTPTARPARSPALNSGKHTTTSTTWYWLDDTRQTGLIDSPGFQEFGLHHIDASDWPTDARSAANWPLPLLQLHPPARTRARCSVQAAVGQSITAHRYRLYNDLHAELSATGPLLRETPGGQAPVAAAQPKPAGPAAHGQQQQATAPRCARPARPRWPGGPAAARALPDPGAHGDRPLLRALPRRAAHSRPPKWRPAPRVVAAKGPRRAAPAGQGLLEIAHHRKAQAVTRTGR